MPRRLSREQFTLQVEELRSRNITIDWTFDDFTRVTDRYIFMCLAEGCGHHWSATWDSVVNVKSGCPECSTNAALSLNKFNLRIESLRQRNISVNCTYDSFEGVTEKYTFKCLDCGHNWRARWYHIVNVGHSCGACARKRNAAKRRGIMA